MKNKAVSFVIGIVVGILGSYGYTSFYGGGDITPQKGNIEKNISGEISDEQMQRIVERTGIAEDVIQSRIDSGESMRDIMGNTGEGKKAQ